MLASALRQHPDRMPEDPAVSVVIGDDSKHMRDALSLLLAEAGLAVAGVAGDARTLVAVVEAARPDLLVTDVRMPPACSDDGLRAAIELRLRRPELRVLLLSHEVQRCYAEELLATGTGGAGYLLKQRAADVPYFVRAVHEILEGGTVLDRELAPGTARHGA